MYLQVGRQKKQEGAARPKKNHIDGAYVVGGIGKAETCRVWHVSGQAEGGRRKKRVGGKRKETLKHKKRNK